MKLLQTTMLRRDPLILAAWLLVSVWLAGTASAFWYFELSDWRDFGARQASTPLDRGAVEEWFRTEIRSRQPAATDTGLTFVHVYRPDCRCNRFAEAHLQRLQAAFGNQNVRFLAAPSRSERDRRAPLGLQTLHSASRQLRAAGVDSAPSALIFDGSGRLIYYGPYGNSAWCGSTDGVLETVLKRASSGLARFVSVPAVRGCFCEW